MQRLYEICLGPLGRYRPGFLRKDLAQGFKNCERNYLPQWARLPRAISPEERFLLDLELAGKVVYDIGAHVGAYTLFFSRCVGTFGRVVAFEPQPRSFAKLARNVRLNGIVNVQAVPVGVGALRETRPLFMLPWMRTTASLAPEARTFLRMRAGVSRVDRLDELVRSLSLPSPDFIKIDVEGMEAEVLEGAADTLRRWHPVLLIEVHGPGPAARSHRAAALADALDGLGYRVRHAETGRPVGSAYPGCAGGHLVAQYLDLPAGPPPLRRPVPAWDWDGSARRLPVLPCARRA